MFVLTSSHCIVDIGGHHVLCIPLQSILLLLFIKDIYDS